ncbi:MAG: hypothetical protein WAK44_26130 [Trebonia sp.]
MLTAPAAMPARERSTAPIAVADSGAIASPAPIPTRNRPGITTHQLDPVLITPCASAPAAMTSSPLPISSRGDVVCSTRPIAADTPNAARLAGSSTRPAWIGVRPSTVWSHSDSYVRLAHAAADSSAPATSSVVNGAWRSSARSSIGYSLRRSTRTNTTSAATEIASITTVRPVPHAPRISA